MDFLLKFLVGWFYLSIIATSFWSLVMRNKADMCVSCKMYDLCARYYYE